VIVIRRIARSFAEHQEKLADRSGRSGDTFDPRRFDAAIAIGNRLPLIVLIEQFDGFDFSIEAEIEPRAMADHIATGVAAIHFRGPAALEAPGDGNVVLLEGARENHVAARTFHRQDLPFRRPFEGALTKVMKNIDDVERTASGKALVAFHYAREISIEHDPIGLRLF